MTPATAALPRLDARGLLARLQRRLLLLAQFLGYLLR